MISFLTVTLLSLFSLNSAFATYEPNQALEDKVEQVSVILINIVDAQYDSNYDMLLNLLQWFEAKVAWNEEKERILESLVGHITDKKNMSDNSIIQDETTWITKEFHLNWFNFWYSQETISVQVWDTVTINLHSTQWYHDRVLDEFNAKTEALNVWDEPVSVTFIADKVWTFEYYCSIWSHRANWMIGNLIVE